MNKNTKVIILVIIALILGYAIYNQQKNKTTTTVTPPIQSSDSKLIPAALSADERFILNPPPSDASASAKKKHAETVAKLAKEGSLLEIKACQPNILVLQVKQGSELQIKNMDNTKHKLTFDSEHIYDIEPNGKKEIKVDFKYGTGDYGYVCEGVGLTGFLHIIP